MLARMPCCNAWLHALSGTYYSTGQAAVNQCVACEVRRFNLDDSTMSMSSFRARAHSGMGRAGNFG